MGMLDGKLKGRHQLGGLNRTD